MNRHPFKPFMSTRFCDVSGCGELEGNPIHLSDDVEGDRFVPFEQPTTPLTDRAEQNTSGRMRTNTPPANVDRSPLPAQESGLCPKCGVDHFNAMHNALTEIFDYSGRDIQAIKNTAYRALPDSDCLLTRYSDASKVWELVMAVANGCVDYGGGYRSDDEKLDIFHHGIQTVCNALEAAQKRGLDDTQVAALYRVGITQRSGAVNSGDSSDQVESTVPHLTESNGSDASGYVRGLEDAKQVVNSLLITSEPDHNRTFGDTYSEKIIPALDALISQHSPEVKIK